MDFLLLTHNPFGIGILLVLLLVLVRKAGDIIWVIAVSIIAKSLAKNGYDVAIDRKGVNLVRSKSRYSRKTR
jgi:hypothetical protein